jgi:uncharacterized protein YfaS (alpha-2-macroglobulin family)
MTILSRYTIGALVRCSAAFTTAAGVAQNPGAVSFTVREPDGTATTYVYGTDAELVRASTGNYYVDVDATEAGTWRFRFAGTGTGQAAAEGMFRVDSSRLD